MPGHHFFGDYSFEILLEDDRRILPFRRPRLSIRTVPGGSLVVTQFGGFDPYILKGTVYTATQGVYTYNGLNSDSHFGKERGFGFAGKVGLAILTVLDEPRFEHAGDAMWVNAEWLLTRW